MSIILKGIDMPRNCLECPIEADEVDDDGFDEWYYSSLEKIYPKYCRKMGTVRKSSHKARKTFISTLLEGGVNVDTIRAEAGQQYLSTMFDNYSFDRRKPEEKNKIMEEAIKGLF